MTTTSTGTRPRVDLAEAIDEALKDWPATDRAGLAQAIREDARASVLAEQGAESTDIRRFVEATELRMLNDFLAELRPAPVTPPAGPGPIDMVGEIRKVVPFLTPDQCHLLGGEVYSHLEQLVGRELTKDMSEDEFDEFGYFVDGDTERVRDWFAANLPEFESLDGFAKLTAANPGADRDELIAEFGANQWLALYRPEYPQVARTQFGLLLRALRQLADEVGEYGMTDWAMIQAWIVGAFTRREDPRVATDWLARRVARDGGAAMLRWAQVQQVLGAMDERVAVLEEVPDAR